MENWGRTLIGLVTLLVMVAGAWYVIDLVGSGDVDRKDYRLVLRFTHAHGVPVGGWVLHKGVRVGEVLKVKIAPDDSGVVMETAISGTFRHTLRDSTRFWIVRPRFAGLSKGISGLDTLIKDPYVEYDTPDLGSPALPSGSVVFGLDLPPVAGESIHYSKKGSFRPQLFFKVKFKNAGGLREGAPVLHRDIKVGTVLRTDLSPDGRFVEVDVVINGRYRESARQDSVFWVATPNVEVGFHWPSFVNVQDLSKLLTGAALAYATPTGAGGRLLRPGTVIDGADRAPKDLDDFQGPLVSIEPDIEETWSKNTIQGIQPVGVSLSFTESDLFRDNSYFLQGTGFLFEDAEGRKLVFTARTLADGAYSCSDLLGDPDIGSIDLKVRLNDRTVHEAALAWIDPSGRDAALIELESGTQLLTATHEVPKFSDSGPENDAEDSYFRLVAFREGGEQVIRSQPIPANTVTGIEQGGLCGFSPELNLDIKQWWGALLLDHEGRIIGIVGRKEALSGEPACAVFEELPRVEKR